MTTPNALTPEQVEQARRDELDKRYADRLQFLWEQYNKLMGLGAIAAATTVVFLLQGVFNKDVREIITKLNPPVDTSCLSWAIGLAAFAALCFIVARWCSQILMERQVYGRYEDAERYFKETLNDETIWPSALQPKKYSFGWSREKLLKRVGTVNEVVKWLGVFAILGSWATAIWFAWPLIASLSVVP